MVTRSRDDADPLSTSLRRRPALANNIFPSRVLHVGTHSRYESEMVTKRRSPIKLEISREVYGYTRRLSTCCGGCSHSYTS